MAVFGKIRGGILSVRLLFAALIASISIVRPSVAQNDISGWFSIPPEQSAIVIYSSTEAGLQLAVGDPYTGEVDISDWEYPLPLVRQYRVPPGEYRILVDEIDTEFVTNAKPGEISYFQIIDSSAKSAAFAAVKASVLIQSELMGILGTVSAKVGYDAIEPRYFAPAKNEIYIKYQPPGVRPPPH